MSNLFRLKSALVNALLRCHPISDRHTRDSIIDDLPDGIGGRIPRHAVDRTDVMNVISVCVNYPNGLTTLLEIVRWHEGDSIAMQAVDEMVVCLTPLLETQRQSRTEHATHITDLLAQARASAVEQPTPAAPSRKIDRNLIVNFDLETLVSELYRGLAYEGVFAFAVGGPYLILENYVVARIREELRRKMQRPYRALDVQLYQGDIAAGLRAIEHKLAQRYRCERLCDLFGDRALEDIMLVVWNYDVPPNDMRQVAQAFWNAATAQVLPRLQNHSRCFVVVWANVGFAPLEDFMVLPTPQSFDPNQLKAWFRGRLQQLALEQSVIDHYLVRLENQQGHLIGTFQEMTHILNELQGGTY